MNSKVVRLIALGMTLVTLSGCGNAALQTSVKEQEESSAYIDEVVMDVVKLEDEAVALSESPSATFVTAVPAETGKQVVVAEATGKLVQKTAKAVIDYSNTADGYVMVKFTGTTSKRLKAQVQGPNTTYTYNINQGEWTVFPLSDGNGSYQFKVYESISGSKYSLVASASQNVTMTDEFAPFIRPNQYVDYNAASQTVAKAQELVAGLDTPLKKVEAIYDYVIHNLTYDKEKAATVTSGYLPVLDNVLESKKGICFDYAALMAGMLRSQGVPCKLVIGYAGSVYHAWINVWSEETGWIEGAIFFDGTAWHRMDPTYASTGKQSAEIMSYIGDGKNYTAKYIY